MKCNISLIALLISFSLEIRSFDVTRNPNNNTALYILSYIKNNHTSEVRNISAVDPSEFLNIESYSGFLTVDEKYNSNLFFWYFPKKTEAPWILWLQGGPGVTSMYGLFAEFGPFKTEQDSLKLRTHSWHKEFSMLYIDNPIGAGFSFTNNWDGAPKNLNETTDHLMSALHQLLQVFPELRTAPFYIAGESFAGRYAPDLALRIMQSYLHMNFQGLILGNAIINHNDISNYTSLFYHWGMIDTDGVMDAKPLQDAYFKALQADNSSDALNKHDELLDHLEHLAAHYNDYNAMVSERLDDSFRDYITKPKVQEALHVGNIQFTFSNNTKLRAMEFLRDMVPTIETLLNHGSKILIYCGQLDLLAPCVESSAARRSWNWSTADEFLAAKRQPWFKGRVLAGYVKAGGGLTEVLVRNAGHVAPADRPAEMLDLVTSFINSHQLPRTPYDDIEPDIATTSTPLNPVPHKETQTVHPSSGPGFMISVSLNVILVIAILIMVLYYWRKTRRSEDFYYTEDSLSDGILTMS